MPETQIADLVGQVDSNKINYDGYNTRLERVQARAAIERGRKAGMKAQAEATIEEIKALDPILDQDLIAKKIELLKQNQVARKVIKDKEIEDKILWKPHVGKQISFLSSTEYEVLFCGGRGFGKTDCLLVDVIRWVEDPTFKGLLIRKTMPALRDIIRRAVFLFPKIVPGAHYSEKEKMFTFPSGATIEFGYLDHPDDYDRYHGREFNWLGIDELSQYGDQETYEKLKSVVRSTNPSVPKRVRCTTNPNGPGRAWIREYFLEAGEENTTIVVTHTLPDSSKVILTRKWIRGTVFDNPTIVKNDPAYVAWLMSLPDVQRRQWLDGDFDAVEGVAFPEFRRDTHVIEPFKIPSGWQRIRGCDWGYRSMAACLWLAIDPEDNIYVYRELTTTLVHADDFARKILELEEGEYISYGVIDNQADAQGGSSGPTAEEDMRNVGVYWIHPDKSKGTRVQHKYQIHNRLRLDPITNKPKLFIFNTCRELIKELSSLGTNPNNSEDVDTTQVDHCFTEGTEILTNEGWKDFKDLSGAETVATLTPEYTVEYQKPVEYINTDYLGEVYSYDNNGMSFSVTPNHKMCYLTQYSHKKSRDKSWQLKEVQDIDSGVVFVPRVGNPVQGIKQDTLTIAGKEWDTKTFFWLMGFWLAEGCSRRSPNRHAIIFDQKEDKEYIVSKFEKCPIPFSTSINKSGCTRYYWQSKPIFDWFVEQGLTETKSNTKFIPRWMLDFDAEYLKELYDGMMFGDGCQTQHSWHYDTASKQLADNFQELLFKIGMLGNIYVNDWCHRQNSKHHIQYRVNIRRISTVSELHKSKIVKENYSGKVYCVTVPKHHTIYIRKDGKPMWCGQSYDALRYALASRPERFNAGINSTFKNKPVIVDPRYGY